MIKTVLLALSLTATGALAQIPNDEIEFTEFVASRARKQVSDPITIKAPLILNFGQAQANLHRIFSFCNQNPDKCISEIDRYVEGMVKFYSEASAPLSRDAIRAVIRTEEYVAGIQASLKESSIQYRRLVEGLAIVLVLDLPQTIKMLKAEDNKALGLTSDEVYQVAFANLNRTLPPLVDVAKPAYRGQIGYFDGDPYYPSRLALHSSWAPLVDAQNGKLIVAVPTKDTLLYIGEDTPLAIDALRTRARDLRKRSPQALSDLLLRWTKSGWEIVR